MEELLIFDETMVKALAAVGNRVNRVGTGKDVGSEVVINDVPKLSCDDCYNLIEGSDLLREAVTAYPADSLRLMPQWNITDTNIESGDIADYIQGIEFVDIADRSFWGKEAIKEAQTVANIEGNAYIWVDVDDGLEPSEPIDFNRISTVYGGSIFGRDSISYVPMIVVNGEVVSGGNYIVSTHKENAVTVHRSRVIEFCGTYSTGSRFRAKSYRSDSKLQSIYQKFCSMELTSNAVYNYLQTASLFSYKMKDLANLALQKKSTDLQKRFSTFLQMVSSLGGFVLDADREEIDFVNRNFSGLEPLIEKTIDQFVAAVGVPKSRLFKATNQGAMSESGKSDQKQWAELVANYQTDVILPKLARLTDIVLTAADSPTRGQDLRYSITFPSILVKSDEEMADTYEKYARADKAYFDMGLSGKTIIDSRFGGTEFGTSITLGENYMKEETDQSVEPVEPAIAVVEDSEKLEIDPYDMPLTPADYESILGLLASESLAEDLAP
jgi:phage-related protein (TIGR01555 family)